jgi:hypothetical protein
MTLIIINDEVVGKSEAAAPQKLLLKLSPTHFGF